MTPRNLLAMLAAMLGAAGCTSLQWVKADVTPAELQADLAACRQAAWREAWLNSWYYRPIAPWAVGPYPLRDPFWRPFHAWPYGPFYQPFGDPFFEESRLAQFCMQAKGYHLEPVERDRNVGQEVKG